MVTLVAGAAFLVFLAPNRGYWEACWDYLGMKLKTQ